MSSLSIAPTDSLKRPFIPEDQDQGPVQKKQKVSSDAEVIACLADTICKFGEALFSEDDDPSEKHPKCPLYIEALEAGDSNICKFMKPELSDILGVSVGVDRLYTEVLERLKPTATRKLEKVEVKASENIPSDSAAVIKMLENTVHEFVDYLTADRSNFICSTVIRILTESSKLNSNIDKAREVYLDIYLEGTEDCEPSSSDLDPPSYRFIIRMLTESSKLNPEDDKLREWNINKYLDSSKEVDFDW